MIKSEMIVRKLNCGIETEVLNKRLKNKEKLSRLHWHAHSWWQNRVLELAGKTFEWFDGKEGGNGYQEVSRTKVWNYEPWGWYLDGRMADTGSVPTAGRKETLRCYQLPLKRKDLGDGRIAFETRIQVEIIEHSWDNTEINVREL